MRILTILVRYGLDRYATAEEEIGRLFALQLPEVEREVLVVDNALAPEAFEHAGRRTLIGGDNEVGEFTGFDRALAWLAGALDEYHLVHLATSAFNTLYTGYLERFSLPALRIAAAKSICLGHIDCYNEPVRIESFVSQHWIRTCFFFLPPPVIRAMGSFASLTDRARFFSGSPAAPFKENAPLSANYRRYIREWLSGADIGQGATWHSRLHPAPDTMTAFEQKALCILNEHMLAIRLRAMGCPVIDVTWLSGRSDTAGSLASVPWREQLAGRDRDRVVVPSAATGG